MKRIKANSLPLLIAVVLLALGAFWFFSREDPPDELTRTEFDEALDADEIDLDSVKILDRSQRVVGDFAEGFEGEDGATDFVVPYTREYGDDLQLEYPNFEVDTEREPLYVTLLLNLLPLVILVGAFMWFISSMQGGAGGVKSFAKARAHKNDKDEPQVTFADVAGQDEAVEELEEIKEFLRNPDRFAAIGAKIPKGVLLFGPPGTGKTLLARAVAGEAGAPFYSISGSDFVEMFVGVGASRVRDLFNQAKENAPSIIFVDEIDAVGRHRGAGVGGGHDEREQTLNQLLVEMDGFDATTGVIMIAASNRPDILDPALLRPGRFDRQIVVDAPDLNGRRDILKVHARGKPLAEGVDLDVVARRTPGFTGADLANLLNEGALLAARRGGNDITHVDLEAAIDRVIAGPERKNRFMSEKEKRVIAYHEAGHALVGHVLPNTPPIHKVTIIARGRALGITMALPTEDRYLQNRSELEDQMAMLLGGRTAEELIFGDPTTGASDDINRATDIARAMVTQFGMTEALGPLRLGREQGEVFLGREVGHQADYSNEVAGKIDQEIRRLVDAAHDEAREILTLHRATLDRLADALVETETLDDVALGELFAGIEPGSMSSVDELDIDPAVSVGDPLPESGVRSNGGVSNGGVSNGGAPTAGASDGGAANGVGSNGGGLPRVSEGESESTPLWGDPPGAEPPDEPRPWGDPPVPESTR